MDRISGGVHRWEMNPRTILGREWSNEGTDSSLWLALVAWWLTGRAWEGAKSTKAK